MTRISAVMAIYNGQAYLRECIDSMLGQTLPPDEIIIVDDGSTDGSADLLAGYGNRIRWLHQPNSGQAAALVAALALTTGELLAINDQDDVWPSARLEHQAAALAADANLDAVFGLSEQFVSPELPPEDQQRFAPRTPIMAGYAAQCMLLRRSAYDRIGGFDPTRHGAFFVEWLARAQRSGYRSLMLDEVVHRRRLHLNNYGRTTQGERDRNLLSALRAGLVARARPTDPS